MCTLPIVTITLTLIDEDRQTGKSCDLAVSHNQMIHIQLFMYHYVKRIVTNLALVHNGF